jgi:hypothetical protein
MNYFRREESQNIEALQNIHILLFALSSRSITLFLVPTRDKSAFLSHAPVMHVENILRTIPQNISEETNVPVCFSAIPRQKHDAHSTRNYSQMQFSP